MARRDPDVRRAVEFIERRLNQLPQPPTSKASAPDSKLRVLITKAGYRRRTKRILVDLQTAFDEQQIACYPKIDDPRNGRDTRIFFFRGHLPGDLVHDAELFPEEAHLEHFIEANHPMLSHFHDLVLLKRQYPLGPGKKIDLMFRDAKNNDLVGVELKKGKPDDRTVGQISIYLRELKTASEKQGCGFRLILITGQPDPDIENSLKAVTSDRFELWRYKVKLVISKASIDG